MPGQVGKRVLSLWLPSLPLDRRVRLGDPRTEGPFAIIAEVKNAWRLTTINAIAANAGVATGATLADARAICPDLLTEPADPVREEALLRALWRWADRLSPSIALDAPDGLILDITGCAHLFGGERDMAVDAMARLADMQIASRIGIADTKGAATALARYGTTSIALAAPGKTKQAIKDLPLRALRIDPDTAMEMARTGLKSIGDLYAFKTSELARRFGLDLLQALGAASGQEPDPVSPAAADPVYAARMTLPEPIGLTADLVAVLERLAGSVCGRLARSQQGARAFRLTVRCVDTGDQFLRVGFSRPCADVGLVLQQFAHPLDNLKVEFGADWFRLLAEDIEPLHPQQTSFGDENKARAATDRVIATLGNRLGFNRVRVFENNDSHLPEREYNSVEAVDRRADLVWTKTPRKRPLRIYEPPERLHLIEPGRPPKKFQWRKSVYASKAAKGPERLTPEWWREGDGRTRDYWTVETVEGPRLWLLNYAREQDRAWYVAGKWP